MDVDVQVLDSLITKIENSEKTIPKTDEEKLCFQLINDLDHIGGQVQGSLTSTKYKHNEI